MKIITSAFIFISVLALASCSFSTNFVVINKSPEPVLVKYKIKKKYIYPDNLFAFISNPATIAEQDLATDVRWNELKPEQYKVNIETRTIIVTVQPNDALLLETLRDYFEHNEELPDSFHIEEISISGSNGEVHLSDEQARLAFVKNKKYFSLTYK